MENQSGEEEREGGTEKNKEIWEKFTKNESNCRNEEGLPRFSSKIDL